MENGNSQLVDVAEEAHLVTVRNIARGYAKSMNFNLVEETKLVTAVSELSRNMIIYAGGGSMKIEKVSLEGKNGIRITFSDSGPGIKDLDLAMQDGYSTNNGLGLGLPGTKRLVSQMEIASESGKGTRIVITKWI